MSALPASRLSLLPVWLPGAAWPKYLAQLSSPMAPNCFLTWSHGFPTPIPTSPYHASWWSATTQHSLGLPPSVPLPRDLPPLTPSLRCQCPHSVRYSSCRTVSVLFCGCHLPPLSCIRHLEPHFSTYPVLNECFLLHLDCAPAAVLALYTSELFHCFLRFPQTFFRPLLLQRKRLFREMNSRKILKMAHTSEIVLWFGEERSSV